MKRIVPLLLIALALLACDVASLTSNLPGQSAPPTATTVAKVQPTVSAPTQTPAIIIVTATPAPQVPTKAPVATIAPTVPPAVKETVAVAQPTVAVAPPTVVAIQPTIAPQAPASNVPMHDDFNNAAFAGALDLSRWTPPGDMGQCPGFKTVIFDVAQKDGALQMTTNCRSPQYVVEVKPGQRKIINAFEMRFKLAPSASNVSGKFWVQINGNRGGGGKWSTECTILVGGDTLISCGVAGEYGTPSGKLQPDTWYNLKITMAPDTLELVYTVNGVELGRVKPSSAALLSNFTPGLGMMNLSDVPLGPLTIDEIRLDAPR